MSLTTTLEKWIEEFTQDLERRGYSARTWQGYRYNLLQLVEWVGEQANLESLGDLTVAVLEQYQVHLMLRRSRKFTRSQPRTLTATARNSHTASLKCFFRYLKRSARLLSNPAAELERARGVQRLPKGILTVPEMARLLEAIPKNYPGGLRDWAAVELFYGAGLRRNELLGLELSALRLSEGFVHVMGKGHRERVVPIGRAAQKALQRYLTEGRPHLGSRGTQALFVSGRHAGRIRERELIEGLRHWARQAGLKKAINFHLFRHTMATHLLRGGADLRSIQTLLGHAQLSTTAIYTKIELSDLQKTIRQCHPREKDCN